MPRIIALVIGLMTILASFADAAPHAFLQDEDKTGKPVSQGDEKERKEVEHWPLPAVEGMTETRTGLKWKVLVPGKSEERPGLGARCRVRWRTWTPDGKEFDSWKVNGKPIEVVVGTTMPGWNEALQLMQPGMKMLVHIPYQLAFGERGRRHIPGKTDIGLELKLIRFEQGPELPAFTPVTPEKQTRLPSGVKYEVLEKGEGEVARDHVDQVVATFDAYTPRGEIFLSTVLNKKQTLLGVPSKLGAIVGGDLAHLLREGAVILAEVPGSQFGGGRRYGSLEPGETSIWRFEVRKIVRREPPAVEPIVMKNGIKCWILREGTGPEVKKNSNVRTMEATWVKNGGCIASSYNTGGPIDYGLKRISKGKRKALMSMKVGTHCYFELPYELVEGAPGMENLAKGTRIIHYIELRSIR